MGMDIDIPLREELNTLPFENNAIQESFDNAWQTNLENIT